jgi:hypothetical protein
VTTKPTPGPRIAVPQFSERETPETIGQEVDYGPVEGDGAARAAAFIAPLLEEGKPRLRGTSAR